MRKLFLILCFIPVIFSQAQYPITLNKANMPFYPQTFNVMVDLKSEISLPETGQNRKWNYVDVSAVPSYGYGFFPAKSPFFPTATYVDTPGISRIIYDKNFISNTYCRSDESGVTALGTVTRKQEIYLGDYTAGKNDNLVIPEQQCVYNTPVKILSFPLSLGSAWHNTFRNSVDYFLTIESLSLFNASFRRVSYFERTDTVVGWGKVTVPDQSGYGRSYDALMLKRATVQKDSFYINGIPATSDVLKSFCLSQGKLTIINRYMFWRENAAFPIMIIHFGSNNFTSPIGIHYEGSAEVPKGINEQEVTKGIQVYPNPNEGRFTIEFTDLESGKANICLYDMLGKEFYNENRVIEKGLYSINMQINKLPKGEYFLVVKTSNNKYLNKVIIL